MSIGHNTVSGEKLRGFVERIEVLRADKKALSQDESAVMAEATAAGFVPAIIRHVVKLRTQKPHDRQEAESLVDLYLHALGMAEEPPLFRAMNAMASDIAGRDSVIDALKKFVPQDGDVIVRMGSDSRRLWRDKDGTAHDAPYVEPVAEPSAVRPVPSSRQAADVPDVDEDGAFALGAEYARENRPVIDNPFPFGDKRRAKFDEGWRDAAGGDGMGPSEDG